MLVSRLWCSFLAAPMFPMANVKEEIMTRIPRMGVNQEEQEWRKKILEK